MAFASASGWCGPEFFLLPGVRQKTAFNLEMKKFFPDAEVDMTEKGYMTEKSFLNWANFFLKSIENIRGNPKAWCLLVIDGHDTHTFSTEALRILNDNCVLLVSLPSHTTNILQVHDVSIFHPLKEKFRQSLSNWKRKNEKFYPAWETANSSLNIKNGLRSTGLWPLNPNWAKDNINLIKSKAESLEAKFTKICHRHLLLSPNGTKGLLDSCRHLDLAVTQNFSQEIESTSVETVLSQIYQKAESHVTSLKQAPKKEAQKYGERCREAKILNQPERIKRIEDLKKKPVEEEAKVTKLRDVPKKTKIKKSQTNPVVESNDDNVEEWEWNSQISTTKPQIKKM